jgi:hypothetical protein
MNGTFLLRSRLMAFESWKGAPSLLVPAFALLLVPGLALGQAQTGNLYARAMDDGGQPLPGATVTLSGIGAPVARPTNENGEVRFLSLSPGVYALSFVLPGFATVDRKNVTVSLNENTQIEVTMKLAAVREDIVVTGESPLLDTRKTGTSTVATRVELDNVPTARDPWVILQTVPGVQIDRVNVGGSESGQQSSYAGKGAYGDQNTWNVDGVNITDMAAIGYSPTYYDFDSFAEMNVVIGGSDASVQTPGVQLNMVTKRGTNDVHGSARVIGTSEKLQSTNISEELQQQLVAHDQTAISNQIRSIQDWGAEVGGPVLKDKLWLWGSYGRNQINNLTTAGYPDDALLEEFGGKLNGQIVPENSFSAVYSYTNKEVVGRSAGPSRPSETAWTQEGPTKIYRLEDSHVFGADLFATVAYSRVIGNFSLASPGQAQAYLDENGIWRYSYYDYSSFRPQTQVTATPSYFLRTGGVGHEIKLGFNYRSTPVGSTTSWPAGIIGYAPGYGFGDQANASFLRPAVRQTSQNYYSGYLSDTMTAGKWTVNLGVRYDYQQSKNEPVTIPPPVYSAMTWPEVPLTGLTAPGTGSLIWRDVSPRIGITYALGNQGKTLVKASFGRFVNQLGGETSSWDSNSPYGPSGLYYNWNDANGNGIVEPGEVDFANGVVGSYYVDPNDPNKSTAINATNYSMKAPAANEFLLGVEHEVMPAFVVGLNGTYRHLGNFPYTPGLNTATGQILTPADFTCRAGVGPYPVPNGSPQTITVCNPNPGIASETRLQTNRPGYYQTYWAIDLNATKRYSDRWMMRLNFGYMSWTQHGLSEGQSDPSNVLPGSEADPGVVVQWGGGPGSAKGYVAINARWHGTLSGMYTLPLDFNVSTSLFAREGYPVGYYRRVGAGGNIPSWAQIKAYVLGSVGDYRLPSVFEWDLGLSKVVTVGPLNVTLMADVFNVLNRNTVLQRTPRIYDAAGSPTASNFNDNLIYEQQSPRIWRFGARLSF